ncbi:MAG: hypothetical protein WAU71_09010 [Pyrinomonadaceae bacterium]
MKLSISNPVFSAKPNNEGGDQYSGTNNGSVNPNNIVPRLTGSMTFR